MDIRPAQDVVTVLTDILSTLRRSTIVPRDVPDKRTRFWTTHKVESDEYDQELYDKYSGRMDNSTIFVSLMSTAADRIFRSQTSLRAPFSYPLKRRLPP